MFYSNGFPCSTIYTCCYSKLIYNMKHLFCTFVQVHIDVMTVQRSMKYYLSINSVNNLLSTAYKVL